VNKRALAAFLIAASLTSACTSAKHSGSAIPAAASSGNTASPPLQRSWGGRSFGELAGKKSVSDAEIDSYIDPGVVGPDRELARSLMKIMPASKRGDFVYFDSPQHIVSNRRDLATDLTVRPVVKAAIAPGAARRSTRGYPPAPFPGSGPYSRMYSKQGITGAIGYVSIPCGTQHLVSSDEGYTYFESVDTVDHKTEGGLEHQPGAGGGDGVIKPYFSTGSFQDLHNAFTYTCHDGPIGIMKGHLPVPSNQTFILTGVPEQSPSTTYLDPNAVVWDRAVWNFFPDGGNYGPAGTDGSGLGTPCIGCYIEKMTTIAQPGGTRNDGSYFGVQSTPSGNYLAIHWEQVEFGEISLPCHGQTALAPGTGTCSLTFNTNPQRWLGNFQWYPDFYTADEKTSNVGSPDPYESYVAIDTRQIGVQSENRAPMGAFGDPHPPTCAADGYGYCVAWDSGFSWDGDYGTDAWGDRCQYWPSLSHESWDVQLPNGTLQYVTHSVTDDGTQTCSSVDQWTPYEPSVQFGDPNLP
jgi:hypothetical protein